MANTRYIVPQAQVTPRAPHLQHQERKYTGPKGPRPREALSLEEVQALLDAMPATGWTGARNRALVALLFGPGLRVSEVVGNAYAPVVDPNTGERTIAPRQPLYPADVDVKARVVHVRAGKGHRNRSGKLERPARTVGMDAYTASLVKEWLEVRKSVLGLNGKQPLICQRDGRQLDPSAVRRILSRAAARAGLEKRVHPHGLRHSHAAQLSRNKVPVHAIQKQLGHASLHTTTRYLGELDPSELVEAVAQGITWGPPKPEAQEVEV